MIASKLKVAGLLIACCQYPKEAFEFLNFKLSSLFLCCLRCNCKKVKSG